MEDHPIEEIKPLHFFRQMKELPHPPKKLFTRGDIDLRKKKLLCIVGSRDCSEYGKRMCEKFIEALKGYPVVIVSGLARGIDSIAHRAALDTNIQTIAFPGSSLQWNQLYPKSHKNLAEDILEKGGALFSEYEDTPYGAYWLFPRRNRLMASVADVVLVIEAGEKSGTLITARLAVEYNKTVAVVPGAIDSLHSAGSNKLLRLGASPITCIDDLLLELGFATTQNESPFLITKTEEQILSYLSVPREKEEIIKTLKLPNHLASIIFASLETKGLITKRLGYIEKI